MDHHLQKTKKKKKLHVHSNMCTLRHTYTYTRETKGVRARTHFEQLTLENYLLNH